jgi:hypothetical protein
VDSDNKNILRSRSAVTSDSDNATEANINPTARPCSGLEAGIDRPPEASLEAVAPERRIWPWLASAPKFSWKRAGAVERLASRSYGRRWPIWTAASILPQRELLVPERDGCPAAGNPLWGR